MNEILRSAAILDFSEVLRINPKNANAYYNRGFAHNNLGNKQAAIDDYTQSIRINPHHADAYNNRGVAHRHLGAIQAAIEDYTQAIRINPHHADAYYNRGFAYHYNLVNIQAAIDDYTQALQINPNYTQAKKDLDVARSKLENTHTAKASSNSNSRTSSSNEVYENYLSALDIDALIRNVGRTISVKGQIISVRVDEHNNIIYFDFTENTSQGFYAYVSASSGYKFFNPTTYAGSNVVVYGRISLNKKNQPRMILNDTSQLRNAE